MGTEGIGTIKNEAWASIEKFISVVLEVLLPIALFGIGLGLLAPAIGLSGFYNSLLSGADLPATGVLLASSGAAIITYAALGGGLIAVERSYDGWIGDVVGALGWMSVGAALRELIAWLTQAAPIQQGAVLSKFSASLSAGIQKVAGGN
jgi:hypothetical protein